MEQSSENLAHCGIVLCFNDSVYLKKMRQDITSSSTYTVLHMFKQVLFGAGNQGNHQNFEKSLQTNKL